MNWRRILIITIIAAASAGGLWWAFRPQPIGVDFATIGRGTLVVTVEDEGVAQVKETYNISTPIGGDVQRIPYEVGDHITAQEVVAVIVPQLSGFLDERTLAEAEAAVRAAEAAVASAETDVQAAQSAVVFQRNEVDRATRLYERALVTQQAYEQAGFELDRRETALANAQSIHELRQRQLEQAQTRLIEPDSLDRRTIRYEVKSPAAGQVLAVANGSARSLPAGADLLTIGDPRNLEVVVDLVSSEAVQVVAGARAVIDDWGGGDLIARVRRVEPIGFTKVSALGIEEQRVRVHLDFVSDDAEWYNLGHQYRVFVRIETDRFEDAILVPTAALFRNGESWAAFVREGETARLVTLSLGARDDGLAVVESGLAAGAEVILHPSDQIVDGGLVAPRD